MNRKKLLFCLALIVTILCLPIPCAYSVDDEYTRETLRGLKGVYVVVEDLGGEIEKAGLTKAQILTDMELKLRMAGIKVLSREDWLKETGMPHLYVNCSVLLVSTSSFVFHITVSLKQQVYLSRGMKVVYAGTTWKSPGIIGINPRVEEVRNYIKDQIDIFINAYLSVNPK